MITPSVSRPVAQRSPGHARSVWARLLATLTLAVGAAAPAWAGLDEPTSAPAAAPAQGMTLSTIKAQPQDAGERGMQDNVDVSLIPRDVLFGNPERAMAKVSPTGGHIAYLAPLNNVLNVFVAPRPPEGDLNTAKPVTSNPVRGVSGYEWAYNGEYILYRDDANGDENFRVYAVDIKTGEKKDLTPLAGVRAEIFALSSKFPDEVVLGLNDRDPMLHDAWRVNVRTGERTLLLKNEGWAEMVIDDDFKVRLGAKVGSDGATTWSRVNDDGSAGETFLVTPLEDTAASRVVGFDKSGKTVYVIDSVGRDTGGLFSVEWDTGNRTLLLGDKQSDVSGVLAHPDTGVVQGVITEHKRAHWNLLTRDLVKDFEFLKKTNVTGDMLITSRSLDDRFWTVSFVEDDGPSMTYLYEKGPAKADGTRAEGKMTFLFANRPALEKLPLVKMHPVIIKTRDGLDMVCYYSLPMARDPDANGKPDKPTPMVLNVHGGPWARDSWGLDAEHQWLANRGYAVLSVNYRGSEGFGKAFLNAGNKEWAGKMHDDLLDAVDWAVKEGIADKSKVAIYGGSYGGYATLVGLTFTPDVFACGVDIVGPSNLESLLKSFPAYWGAFMDQITARVGDHRTEEGREFLKSRSPLTFVDKIKKPLLIAQGANDPRVKQAESDQIVAAMKSKNLPVTYVLYPDEGHGFARPPNRMSFYAVAEAFLAQHLGGRVEPIGSAFNGSTIEVREGADQVPGLSEALSNKK